MAVWREFLDRLRCANGELSAYWMTYVDTVENVILGLLRACREGDWNLHLHAIRKLTPWCFAYDKVSYSRYLTPYYAQMTRLGDTHPDVQEAFEKGHFSVQLSDNNPFGRMPVDQTTEVTVNKDTQTPGGTARFSLKPSAVKRYYLTAEYRSEFLGQMRNMVQGNLKSEHSDLQRSRIRKDEKAVSSVVEVIQGWNNPFTDEEQDLVSLSTARAASKDVARDLKIAYETGEKCYTTFKDERMEKVPQIKKFHDPIKSNKLKTFSNMNKAKKVSSNGRTVILKADRSLFGRIIVMAQGRNLEMREILTHPLGPLPWSLSTPDGLLRKTNKASLANQLQKNVPLAERVPNNCAVVIDGMSLVQKVKADRLSFGDVADTVLDMALREGAHCKRVDVVFDVYREVSIKNSERSMRGEATGHQLSNIASSQIVRQWRKFLSGVLNKTSLINFIVTQWRTERCREKLVDKELYATKEATCYRITKEKSEEVPSLQCTQEEADGRLLLHASHAADAGYGAVIICSEDTDVFIIAIAFQGEIGVPLFMKCGNRNRTKLINISGVVSVYSTDVCKAAIGMHAYTGCDSVSAFAGRGKAPALKLLINDKESRDTFDKLGKEWNLTEGLINSLEKLTCRIYVSQTPTTSINDLRYELFCARKGEIESHQLPPCRDCLVKHAMRANYQAAIWRRCLQQDPGVPTPLGKGWKKEQEEGVEELVVDWMDGRPAPDAILDLLSCNCTKTCSTARCTCIANGLRCTDMCRLQTCENRHDDSEDENDSEDDVDSRDSDDEDVEEDF